MSATKPPDLPKTMQPNHKPIWKWALLIAGASGAITFLLADMTRSSGYRAGYAFSAAAMPLLGAWFATLASKKPHVPTIVTGALVVLMLSGGNTTHRAINRVSQEYSKEIAGRTEAWGQESQAWQASGGCDSSVIKQRDQLRTNLDLALSLKETTGELLADYESGELFLAKLADAGVDGADSAAAWSRVQADDDYKMVLEIIRASDELLQAAGIFLSELDHNFGQWSVEGDDGMVMFDEGFSDLTLKRINDAVEVMEACNARITKAVEGQK